MAKSKKMSFKQFEKSGKDKDKPGGPKEGSKAEEAEDKKQFQAYKKGAKK